jgi:hypothetical protein
MKLTVVQTVGTRRGLEVWFKEHIIAGAGTLNEKGVWAWRVLQRFAPDALIFNPESDFMGHCLLVESRKGIEGFETPAAAQMIFDQFINASIEVKFLRTAVIASDHDLQNQVEISNHGEAYQATVNGKFVFIELVFQFSLPVHSTDMRRVQRVLPGTSVHTQQLSNVPNGVMARILLTGPLVRYDPWKLIEELQSSISALLL